MILNFKKSGSGPPLVILHGLLGMLDNWQSIARRLESEFTIYLVDQRNHGKSPHTAEHSYILMANDLHEFFIEQQLHMPDILGHSMGGKTAMQFALVYETNVHKLIIVDMGIKQYLHAHDSIFNALLFFDIESIRSREDAETQLSMKIKDAGELQFVLKNLVRNADATYSWKFNLSALYNNYASHIAASLNAEHPFPGKTLFMRGAKSNYILNEDWDKIQEYFPQSTLITIANSGHWVHADNPDELMNTVRKFLLEQ